MGNKKRYYISDLHLFHQNVVGENNFDKRPFQSLDEMHEEIVKRWNSKVTNADDVFILGDICWKENEDAIQLVSRLRGHFHAIRGNHDKFTDERYRRIFEEIVDYKEVQDTAFGKQQWLVLSHYPLSSWNHMRMFNRDGNQMKNYAIHLYGHVHSSVEYEAYQRYLKMLKADYNIQVQAYNVGSMIDYMDYTPRTLEEIITANKISKKN